MNKSTFLLHFTNQKDHNHHQPPLNRQPPRRKQRRNTNHNHHHHPNNKKYYFHRRRTSTFSIDQSLLLRNNISLECYTHRYTILRFLFRNGTQSHFESTQPITISNRSSILSRIGWCDFCTRYTCGYEC